MKDGTAWVVPSLFNEVKEDPECIKIVKSPQALRYYMKQFAEAGVLLTSNGDERYNCRHNTVKLWNSHKVNHVKVVAPGQFFRIKPEKNIQKIAKYGILRKVLFGQFGFGEYMVHD